MPRIRKLEALSNIIVEGYRCGASIAVLALTHSVSSGTIINILKRHNVVRRPRGRVKRSKPVQLESKG